MTIEIQNAPEKLNEIFGKLHYWICISRTILSRPFAISYASVQLMLPIQLPELADVT